MNLDYDLDAFEIIIVDDGSESSFQASYLEYIDLHDELMIHYHYISDKKGNFRVNMARNI
jgi:glycosyltransferase involved in cell wall biosynthesis